MLSVGMDDVQALGKISSQLSEIVALQATNRKLLEFDGTVAAVNLRPELSRVLRHLDTLSETITIVVKHLPAVAKVEQP